MSLELGSDLDNRKDRLKILESQRSSLREEESTMTKEIEFLEIYNLLDGKNKKNLDQMDRICEMFDISTIDFINKLFNEPELIKNYELQNNITQGEVEDLLEEIKTIRSIKAINGIRNGVLSIEILREIIGQNNDEIDVISKKLDELSEIKKRLDNDEN